ncbi:MAG: hypothetical protein Q7T66_01510 [Herminiimonas sp.]|uniref:hypothetical protein n=1 Tax=Herminiimonas sp. TaxID=1926289 RepID=UPI002716A315|nr:hypothetical protein [Herminiimonas sp.]MDO9419316.1 hypothetical protein [Herminiimonas sp.]
MHTKINWFEIPSTDFGRAIRFYETLFDTTLRLEKPDSDSLEMALFSDAGGIPCGCVTHYESHSPSSNGTLVYLDANPSIDAVLSRVESAGGESACLNWNCPTISAISRISSTPKVICWRYILSTKHQLRIIIRQRIAGRRCAHLSE